MKGQLTGSPVFMGLIVVVSLIVIIVTPPSVIKVTIDKETAFTYNLENVHHTILSILSNKEMYEKIGIDITIDTGTNLDAIEGLLKDQFTNGYCMSIFRPSTTFTTYAILTGYENIPTASSLGTLKTLLGNCASLDAGSNTILVLPYRPPDKNNLVEIIRVGKK
ncbi:MAG: hypothetical protein HYW23_03910 [Candidatus Aenigmarchaeota archaeon]|nr:hypothetical protein [Candidatus Aenigmarchaeota archaeon]